MMKKPLILISAVVISLALVSASAYTLFAQEASPTCNFQTDAFCYAPRIADKADRLENVTMPKIATPGWLAVQTAPPAAREVKYVVQTRGTITADFDEFKNEVNDTLNSPQGWSRLGVRFTRVDSDGQFTVWLTEASQVPTFSQSGCDTVVSCTVGNNVIINQTRWLNGSDSWNGAGGTLRDYRHMVVNHETGHWLGHGHEQCSGPGQPAAVMQQQTINMQGCTPNPWPLQHEMYSPKLGIRS